MKIIWVSPSGDDLTGGGSYEYPYKTIEKAISLFVSGDQIRLMPGTYTPTDSVVISGKDGSIFSEEPNGAYIQPEKTTVHQAGVAILDSGRFILQGINVLQAAQSNGNLIGIYVENIETFLAYTCAVSDFEIPSGDGYGIFASGSLGRIEKCHVYNLSSAGENLYGIRTIGIDIIDCETTALSGAGDCDVHPILYTGLGGVGP